MAELAGGGRAIRDSKDRSGPVRPCRGRGRFVRRACR
ncbi:MAG: hypothetical protein M3460_16525 [Actinomycetota bacterium]|nr:hypothetical protein [Actinomycetota bacterium]